MDRERGCRAGYSRTPSSSTPMRHFSRSPCHNNRRYSESRSSSSSSSDSYCSKRYKRFDKFKNESHRNQEIRYETKENYSSSRYQSREEKTRRWSTREGFHRKDDTHDSQLGDDGISRQRYPERDGTETDARPYAPRKSYPDHSVGRKYRPDKVPSQMSRGAEVKEHVTYSSPELGASQDDSSAEDGIRYKERVTRSRGRLASSSSDGSSSGRSERFDWSRGVSPKFHQRRDERLVKGLNKETCRTSKYTEKNDMKFPYKSSGKVEKLGAMIKSDKMVDEKPLTGSSHYRESVGEESVPSQHRGSRGKERKSRKSSKRDLTKSSRCYNNYTDDRSDYTRTRSTLQVNDFNLNLNSPATPAILNINFNSTVRCGTNERKSAAVPHTSQSYDHHHHRSHSSSRTRRGDLVNTAHDYTDQISRNQGQYRPSRSDVKRYSYREHRRGAGTERTT